MDYITTVEAGRKWGITANRIFILARSGRIPGAVQIGSRWMIPANAQKPSDKRTKSWKKSVSASQNIDFFRYPLLEHKDPSSFYPPLSPEELQIKTSAEHFYACRFEECDIAIGSLPETSANRYIRIYTLYEGCMTDIFLGNTSRFFKRYGRLLTELQEDFPHKKEMQECIHELDATLGANAYYTHRFRIDPEYKYHESFLPHLNSLCCVSLSFAGAKMSEQELVSYEMNCILLENSGCLADLQATHVYLGSAYAFIGMTDKMTFHIKEALSLAEKYELYYIPALHYYYVGRLFEPALKAFSKDFNKEIINKSQDIHARYLRFMDSAQKSSIYRLLPRKEFLYIYYASLGYTNDRIAKLLGLSAGTVGKTYSAIYDTLGVTGKKELTELYLSSVSESQLEKND